MNSQRDVYYFITNPEGRFLGKDLRFSHRTSDDEVWQWRDGVLSTLCDSAVVVDLDEAPRHGMPVVMRGVSDVLHLQIGPARTPAEHLAELKATGLTIVENVLPSEDAAQVRQEALDRLAQDAPRNDVRVGIADGMAWSRAVAECVAHPLALWLIETYLDGGPIHFCHQPAVTVLRPAKELAGRFPEGGWHSDYPYHRGVLEDSRWTDEAPLAVQFNICVDEFRAANGATQYMPGSHEMRRHPPTALNRGGTRMGEGVHDGVRQMLAPAGAALIYDARVWHRACEECNVSGEDRVAILNAVAHGWVRPMSDKSPGTTRYRASGMASRLNARVNADIERLCHSPTLDAPPGAPGISPRQ